MLLDDPHVAQDAVEVEGIVVDCIGDVGYTAGVLNSPEWSYLYGAINSEGNTMDCFGNA